MSSTLKFDDKDFPSTKELFKLNREGYTILCPKCGAKLFFNDTEIGCSRDAKHFYTFGCRKLSPHVREELDRRRKNRSIANMKKKGYTEEQIQKHIVEYYPNVD